MESKTKQNKILNLQIHRTTDRWLSVVGGWGGKMAEGGEKVQTSSYKIKYWGYNVKYVIL